MKVYNYNSEGYLLEASELDNSDKCQITGDWLIPAQATEKEPLAEKEGFKVKFNGIDWEYEKILTDEEKKIKVDLPLEEGEIVQNSKLIKVEKPSNFHTWNFDSKEWEDLRDLPEEKSKRSAELKSLRDSSLEQGIYFEKTKLIKGRTQDLADATAIFNMFQLGVQSVTWYYSNGISEEVDQVKMLQIYQAIGNFRNSQFTKEAQLKAQIEACITLEELDSIVW